LHLVGGNSRTNERVERVCSGCTEPGAATDRAATLASRDTTMLQVNFGDGRQ